MAIDLFHVLAHVEWEADMTGEAGTMNCYFLFRSINKFCCPPMDFFFPTSDISFTSNFVLHVQVVEKVKDGERNENQTNIYYGKL